MEVWINSYFQPPSAPENWYLHKCRFCFCFRRETLSNLYLSYWATQDMGDTNVLSYFVLLVNARLHSSGLYYVSCRG
jgi:hypothetical protein